MSLVNRDTPPKSQRVIPPQQRCVAGGVVIRRKNVSNLDGIGGRLRRIDLKSIVPDIAGRKVAEFGTVRPRVQISGPTNFCRSG